MKKQYIFILIIMSVFIVLCFHKKEEKDTNIIILDEKSYFNDYIVENDTVKINCVITLENKSDIEKTVKIIADFEEEVDLGLLKKANLTAYFLLEKSEELILPPHSTRKYLDVVFTGEYGGKTKMKNRNLPKLEVVEID